MDTDKNQLLQVLYFTDKNLREQSLQAFPKAHKDIFCKSLVAEIITQHVPPDSSVQSNFVDHCSAKITQRIGMAESVEGMQTVKNWLENKCLLYRDALGVREVAHAFLILADQRTSDEEFEIAVSLLEKILNMMNAHFIGHAAETQFLNNLLELAEIFPSLESLKARSLCKLFTVAGRKLLVVGGATHLAAVIDILKACAGTKELAELTFPFWTQLGESNFKTEHKPLIQAYAEQFLLNITAHCAYSNVENVAMERFLGSELLTFRDKVVKVIDKLAPVMDPQRIFEFFLYTLEVRANSFEDVEVCLFVVRCIASSLDHGESVFVPQFLHNILLLDEGSNPSIVHMAAQVVGQLSEWINVNRQTFLTAVLQWLFKFFTTTGALASVAAESMAKILCASKRAVHGYIPHLLSIVEQLDSYSIHSESELKFINAVAVVIFSLPSDQHVYEAMCHLCTLQISKISLRHDDNALKYVDQLAEIYHTIPAPTVAHSHPAAQVFIENWPALSQILDYFRNNADVLKTVAQCLRYAVSSVGLASRPVLEAVLMQLLHIFCEHRHSFILRFLEVAVDTLGSCEAVAHGLFVSFEAFSVATFNGLHDERELNADVMEEYFKLSATCVKRMPLLLLKSPLILRIIDFAIDSCKFKEKHVNKAAMKFLLSVIACNCVHPDIEVCVLQAMTLYSKRVIATLIKSCAYIFEEELMDDVVEILHAFKLRSNQGFTQLLSESVSTMTLRTVSLGHAVAINRVKIIVDSLSVPNQHKKKMAADLKLFKSLFR